NAQDTLRVPPPETPGRPELLGPPGTWHALSNPPASNTEARHGQSSIYDSNSDRIVEFGGFTSGGPAYQDDLLELTPCRAIGWMPLTALGSPPSARFGHSAIYDPVRKRMIL